MDPPPPSDRRELRRGLVALALSLAPALAAVWCVPRFVAQDGPAHLYNAHILRESLREGSPFRDIYEVRWEPLPNWAGHLALMGLLAVTTPGTADRAVMSLTLVGLAAAIFAMRRTVAGDRGAVPSALLAALLGMNITWLYGFWSFLLGASLFPATLGLWWAGRDRFGPGRAVAIAGLLVLGYFCHAVSLGLTAAGLVVLAAFAPPGDRRLRLRGWTLAGLLPLLPLGVVYRRLMRGGGEPRPLWMELKDPLSLASWKAQLGWVDPISLAGKTAAPFVDAAWPGFASLAPVIWLLVALTLLLGTSWRASLTPSRRGWAALAALLLAGGVAGPDTFGASHGNYLALRVGLLGLVALVPVLALDGSRPPVRLATAALAVAVALQNAFVWDYALRSDRAVSALLAAKPLLGRHKKVGTLLIDPRAGTRANPLLHADCLLGIGTGNVIWANYEAAFYYFPVQVRPGEPHPPILEFERLALMTGPADALRRAEIWASLLARHGDEMDRLVVRGRDGRLDAITGARFDEAGSGGEVRVFRRRE